MNSPTPSVEPTATRSKSRRRWLWIAGTFGAVITLSYGGLALVDMAGMLDAPATYDLASVNGQQLPADGFLGGQMFLRPDHSWSVELNTGKAGDNGSYAPYSTTAPTRKMATRSSSRTPSISRGREVASAARSQFRRSSVVTAHAS